jgi:hypothetical protein
LGRGTNPNKNNERYFIENVEMNPRLTVSELGRDVLLPVMLGFAKLTPTYGLRMTDMNDSGMREN